MKTAQIVLNGSSVSSSLATLTAIQPHLVFVFADPSWCVGEDRLSPLLQALTPAQLVGSFASAGCEAYPNGMGGNNYLTRSFTLTEASWHLDLVLFADEACTSKLFTAVIDGPYALLGASATVAGATEGDFSFTTIVWTAHLPAMADTFTMSGCGSEPWEVEVPQDVTATGCIGVAHPIAECPTEHDVVALTGDDLYFGERITDMCSEAGRPAALGAYPVVRI